MNIEMLLNDFNVYCLDENNWLIDNDSLIDYEISHNGVYVNLISIEEGHCSGCDEFDFYIVGNDFYNYSTDYVIRTPFEKINLPVGDDSELECFDFGAKIRSDEITYGINDDKFIAFDDDHLFYSENANLHEFLLEKMKEIMMKY